MSNPHKTDTSWTITINDGFCTYEYTIKTRTNNVSIRDLYEVICKKLKVEPAEGKYIGD
jgi:hypothetical protein